MRYLSPEETEGKLCSSPSSLCSAFRTDISNFQCDGAQPHCQTCIESNLECTYSRQARRRGPPLGFLRHVEVRLHIGDAFLGYVISEDPGLVSELLSRARSFAQLPQDPTSGQAISEQIARWDNWAAQWRETDMSRILDGVSARFATPVSRPELESPLKTSTTATTPPAIPPPPPPMMSRKPASKRSASIESKPHLRSPASDSSSPKTMDFAPTYRHPAARTHASSDVGGALPGGGGFPVVNGHGGNSLEPPPTSWPGDQLNLALADLLHNNNPAQTSGHPGANNIYGGRDPSTSSSASFPHMLQPQSVPFEFGGVAASNSYPWSDHSNDVKPNVHFLSDLSSNSGLGSEPSPARSLGRSRSPDDEGGLVPTETDTVRYQGSATGMHHQALESSYTGSFWFVIENFIVNTFAEHFVLYCIAGEVSQCTIWTTPILHILMLRFRKVNFRLYAARRLRTTSSCPRHIFNNILRKFICKTCIPFSHCSLVLQFFLAATSRVAWCWHSARIVRACLRIWGPMILVAEPPVLEMRRESPLKCGVYFEFFACAPSCSPRPSTNTARHFWQLLLSCYAGNYATAAPVGYRKRGC